MNVYIIEYKTADGWGLLYHIVTAYTEEQARSLSKQHETGRYCDIAFVRKIDLGTAQVIKEIRYFE